MNSTAVSASTLSLNAKQRGTNTKQKEPRPERTALVVSAIVQGIREAILVTEEDIGTLKASLENLSIQSKQVQIASRRAPFLILFATPIGKREPIVGSDEIRNLFLRSSFDSLQNEFEIWARTSFIDLF